MPTVPLKVFKPKTPLARLRREFLFHKNGTRFYQGNLGDDLGVKAVRIQQFELGTRPLPEKHALKLQEIYGISAAWLLGGNPKAKPVTPEGKPYSRAIATNSRLSHKIRYPLSQEPTANLAWHLALSLEALLSEIRAAIIRVDKEKPQDLMAAAALFSEIRDAVLPLLKTAFKDATPPESIVSRLHDGAERLLENPTPEEFWRLDLTRQCLGVDEHPIIGQDGKELEFKPTRDPAILEKFARDTGYRPHARIVGPDGKVIEIRPITRGEAIELQPTLAQFNATPQRLTEAEIRDLFEPVRKRMEVKGYSGDQIRARLDKLRKRQRDAEGKA
jgi:hypothetical protein